MPSLRIQVETTPSPAIQAKVAAFLTGHWGSTSIVSKGRLHNASTLPRVAALTDQDELAGLATFSIDTSAHACEIVSLNADPPGTGLGASLITAVESAAKAAGCHKTWLITTNSNPEAAAFYTKHGYRLVAVHLDALTQSRRLKPQIPLQDDRGIPLLDEWEFEKSL
ncbi:MAG TPA: GNAT family N-acetyltransferase [Candidatus Saccharimonadia bacterium]|nr:GNAT family N-acetyltransferase [Candidatus Saccharimonadia bacterium]